MAEKLMNVEEFNKQVRIWAVKIRSISAADVASHTHESGDLAVKLSEYVDSKTSADPAYKVAFRFPRYGVFRAYGAGRGYKVINGVPVKTGVPNKYRGYKIRQPLDWIDRHVEDYKNELADSVQAYYGDEVLKNVLKVFNRVKIRKNG